MRLTRRGLREIRREAVYYILDRLGPAHNGMLARQLGLELKSLRVALRDLQNAGRADAFRLGRRQIWFAVEPENLMFG